VYLILETSIYFHQIVVQFGQLVDLVDGLGVLRLLLLTFGVYIAYFVHQFILLGEEVLLFLRHSIESSLVILGKLSKLYRRCFELLPLNRLVGHNVLNELV
jgi:hypothetical protein